MMTVESLQFFWFIAFTINITVGSVFFYMVFKRNVRKGFEGLSWWFGWWSYVDAIALLMNAVLGTDSFWSYHQTGIIIDTAINAGLLVYVVKLIIMNWAMNDEDWEKVDRIAKDAKLRELSK